MPVLIFLANHLCVSGSRVREHSDYIKEIKMHLTTFCVLLRTVQPRVVNPLALEDMTRIYCNSGFVMCVSHDMIRQQLGIKSFGVLPLPSCTL